MTRMRRRGIWPAAPTSRMRAWPSGWNRPPRTPAHAVLLCAPPRWRGRLPGRLDQARVHAAAAVAQARVAGNPVILRAALAAAADLAVMAGEADAGVRLREAVRLPGFGDTPVPYVAPERTLALWYLWRGELAPARDLLNAVISVAERHGSDVSACGARLGLVEVEWRAGNWDAAAAHAAAIARWSRESGFGQQWAALYAVSLIEAGRGDIAYARELAATGAGQAEAHGDAK